MLPIKADVRKAISKQAGDIVTVRLDQRLNDRTDIPSVRRRPGVRQA